MKLFVFEYFSSGAAEERDELKQDGLEMLEAVLEDFGAVSGLELMTVLDASLQGAAFIGSYRGSAAGKQAAPVQVHWRKEGEPGITLFQKMVDTCDSVFIIAPERGGILTKLTAMAEACGKTIWGSSSQALQTTCNKAALLDFLQGKGWPVPRSMFFKKPSAAAYKELTQADFSLPLIVKPVCGAGGEGVRRIGGQDRLRAVLEQMANEEEDGVLVQEFIPGQAVSVSLFILHGKAQVLSLNRQFLSGEEELLFQGVMVPYQHPQAQDITKMAAAACEHLPGLKGFVGVDLVLGPQGPVIIEINARITSAYVALREIAGRNPARDMALLFAQNILPEKLPLQGTYTYTV